MENSDLRLNIVMLGDTNVGKSCLLTRFIKQRFIEKIPFKAIEYQTIPLISFNKVVTLQIWNFMGNKDYQKTIPSHYYSKADGFIVVYDITSDQSFLNARTLWMSQVLKNAQYSYKVLVGNKCDLTINRSVSQLTAKVS
ncbi:unnamed protein product [Dimorphilus gyrociliatus]|uniref:Uncharacterized protein n=1 Tax=Dimorphilus gyrociliatus TaxID=2664684 RepID=A0A7I8VJG7_9ANNE|nr:unnamed protein product [Dimorphilus gyrociliatus]